MIWHYLSLNRKHREEELAQDAPLRKDDGSYGLCLSTWALCTSKTQFEEITEDNLGLLEGLLHRGTVNGSNKDDEIPEVVERCLRQGGDYFQQLDVRITDFHRLPKML